MDCFNKLKSFVFVETVSNQNVASDNQELPRTPPAEPQSLPPAATTTEIVFVPQADELENDQPKGMIEVFCFNSTRNFDFSEKTIEIKIDSDENIPHRSNCC